ncbi:hypothetical protein ASO20_01680 [Mycoplasma sp. (ex Biomphalaria glabrata)]|uniref:single-stranded DNA-binding protein n=1 Tax=Mycoplasma sp. (ex Biomphalaria glabrata) TaxID=1749074 RepID=UPI00073A8C37|nr:single-stranded DNA-binding protein [Mycoplasma sp. (ex Biomphalaria glabrata)]ALV23358.1 hypothetical protein ASO20_01680 [Mycoplasma sp. (ex Biomphalaria glabrata)]
MFNKVILIGRVTKKPIATDSSAGKIARFYLATDRGIGSQKKTDFIPCVAFAKTAETAINYLDKGTLIAIEGRLNVSNYVKDGVNQTQTTVLITTFQFLEKKSTSQKSNSTQIDPMISEMKESFETSYSSNDDFSFDEEIKTESKDIIDWEL